MAKDLLLLKTSGLQQNGGLQQEKKGQCWRHFTALTQVQNILFIKFMWVKFFIVGLKSRKLTEDDQFLAIEYVETFPQSQPEHYFSLL